MMVFWWLMNFETHFFLMGISMSFLKLPHILLLANLLQMGRITNRMCHSHFNPRVPLMPPFSDNSAHPGTMHHSPSPRPLFHSADFSLFQEITRMDGLTYPREETHNLVGTYVFRKALQSRYCYRQVFKIQQESSERRRMGVAEWHVTLWELTSFLF